MKIESTTTTIGSVGETRSRGPVARPEAGAAAEVHLSDLVTQLQVPASETSFDEARVAEITQAIAEGRFTINAGAIADRLLSMASEMIAAQPKK